MSVHPLIQRIRDRMYKKDKHFCCVFTGEPGSGKSIAAIALAYAISPKKFNVRKHVVFTAKELLNLLNQDLEQGTVIVWDEGAGIDMDNRKWYSLINTTMNYVLQTFRYRNLCLIMTVPLLQHVDSKARQLIQGFFEMTEIYKSKKTSYAKYKDIQINYTTGKMYFKYPRFVIKKDGRLQVFRMDKMGFKLPPKEIMKEYETKKAAFERGFLSKLYAGINEQEQELQSKRWTFREMIDYTKKNINEFVAINKDGEKVLSPIKIELYFGIGTSNAYKVRKALAQLGVVDYDFVVKSDV